MMCISSGMDIESAPEKTSGWRGSRELWLRTARNALIEGGPQAVKVQPLAAHLNLSRTSFYWFFKSRAALLDALLDTWDSENSAPIFEASEKPAASPAEAALHVITAFLDETRFDPKFDLAVRSWAQQSPSVWERVSAVDERRISAIRSLMERQPYSAEEATLRARTMYVAQMGYIALQFDESFELRMRRIPTYVRIFSGHDPTDAEMAAFYRHHTGTATMS